MNLFNKPSKTKSPFWRPNPNKRQGPTENLHLENTIEQLKLGMDQLDYIQSKSDNLTKSERIALRNLTDRTDIVINKADKGSTIVVLNKEQYVDTFHV